jgi:hypothetical protein
MMIIRQALYFRLVKNICGRYLVSGAFQACDIKLFYAFDTFSLIYNATGSNKNYLHETAYERDC